MKLLATAAAASMILLLNGAVGAIEPLSSPSFSREATEIWDNIWVDGNAAHTVQIQSPDREKIILASYEKRTDGIVLDVICQRKRFTVDIGPGVGAELAWSPDSKAFFVTSSDEGRTGRYRTTVYMVGEKGIRKIDLNTIVEKAVHSRVASSSSCLESPNVVGVAWLRESSRVLVAAEIANLSICDNAGTFETYELDVPSGRITKSWGQIPAKKQFWQHLGDDLKRARDTCITDPESCKAPPP